MDMRAYGYKRSPTEDNQNRDRREMKAIVDAMADFMAKKFPKTRFENSYPKGGLGKAGGISLGGQYVFRVDYNPPYNATSSGSIKMVAYLGGYDEVYRSPKDKMGTASDVLKAMRAYLKKHSDGLGPWRQKGMSPEVRVALRKMLQDAVVEVQRALPGVRLERYDQGSLDQDIFTISLGVPDGSSRIEFFEGGDATLYIRVDAKRKQYAISSYAATKEFKTVRGIMGGLPKVLSILRKGLKTIDSGQAEMLVGKMTTAIVRGVVSTKVDFSQVNEHHDTILVVELALRTKVKKVPEKIIEDWLTDNWSTVQKAIKNVKFPSPAVGYREQGLRDWDDRDDDDDGYGDDYVDSHDMPEDGLGWLDPQRVSFRDAHSLSVSQNGGRVTARIRWSHR